MPRLRVHHASFIGFELTRAPQAAAAQQIYDPKTHDAATKAEHRRPPPRPRFDEAYRQAGNIFATLTKCRHHDASLRTAARHIRHADIYGPQTTYFWPKAAQSIAGYFASIIITESGAHIDRNALSPADIGKFLFIATGRRRPSRRCRGNTAADIGRLHGAHAATGRQYHARGTRSKPPPPVSAAAIAQRHAARHATISAACDFHISRHELVAALYQIARKQDIIEEPSAVITMRAQACSRRAAFTSSPAKNEG